MINFATVTLVLIILFALQTLLVVYIILHNIKHMNDQMMKSNIEQTLNLQSLIINNKRATASAIVKLYEDMDKAITYSADMTNNRLRDHFKSLNNNVNLVGVSLDKHHSITEEMYDYVAKRVDSTLANPANTICVDPTLTKLQQFDALMRDISSNDIKRSVYEYLKEQIPHHDMPMHAGVEVFDILRGVGVITEVRFVERTMDIEFVDYPDDVFEYNIGGYLTDADMISSMYHTNV